MRRAAGVHLVEIIVAIGVLSMVVVAVLSLLPSSLVAVKRGEVRLQADVLASSLLERTRARNFASLVVNSTSPEPVRHLGGVDYTAVLGIYSVEGLGPERALLLRAEVSGTYRSQPFLVRQEQVVSNVRR